MQRPDLENVDPSIRKYIEYLEKRLGISTLLHPSDTSVVERVSEPLPSEPETTMNVITVSNNGSLKRTYRHLYSRQHRSGMGVFDIDINPPDFPCALGISEENQTVLILTTRARVFRYSLRQVDPSPVHSKGSQPFERLAFEADETVAAILPEQARGYVALLGETGKVRCLRHHLFGEHMRPGTTLFNIQEFGLLSAACWTPGDRELLIVSSQGMGIRFPEKSISPQGDLGIRLGTDDRAIGITSVDGDSQVFLLGADGRGTIRQMSAFAANKSAGGSGKIAIKTAHLVGAASVRPDDDIFVITRLGKIIRFQADEIPSTDGAVQGVNCISMRSDEVSAFITSEKTGPIY